MVTTLYFKFSTVFRILIWNFADTFGTPLATICGSLVAVTPTPRREVGMEYQNSGFWHLDLWNFEKYKVSSIETCLVLLCATVLIIISLTQTGNATFCIKMMVFRPWTLQFFEFSVAILQEASKFLSLQICVGSSCYAQTQTGNTTFCTKIEVFCVRT